ncbi:MAG TPA: class I SAM-dependent methyltransferase [Kofleriaceae bacterium]
MLEGNREAIQAWNTVLFDKFSRFRTIICDGLGVHGTYAMSRHPPAVGARVADLGCGYGDTTQALAKLVGPTGLAVGLDAAERFIAVASSEAAGIENVRFEVADLEEAVPGGPYDHVFSRMGTMFFASPVFAFRNARKAMRPGAKLCIVTWRKREANECLHAAEVAVRDLLGEPPKGDQVTCGPGPFSQASPDLVSDQLIAAGFREPTFERSDAPIFIGASLEEALEFALQLGPAGEIVRLAGPAAAARKDEIDAALRKALAPFVKPDGVFAPASCWIITATNP